MKYLTFIFVVLLLSATTYAVDIPNQFEDGQVTSASQMNENFQALKVEIEALKAQFEQSQTPPKVDFKGFSEPVDSSSGIFNFNKACNTAFPESRICSAKELTFSVITEDISIPSTTALIVNDESGFDHCASNSGEWGPAIRNGYIGDDARCWNFQGIPQTYPVACCK